MGASGDFKELRALRARLTGFGGSGFWMTMSRALAETARERVKESFQQSMDPYGRHWKASWHRRGPDKGGFKTIGQILRDRGILFKSLAPTNISAQGFAISTTVKYAAIHNWGGTITLPYQERANFHGRNGRFLKHSAVSKSIAAKYSGKKGKAFRASIAIHGARSFRMPKRQYMPDGNRVGPIWRKAFFQTARRIVKREMEKGAASAG